MAEYDTMVDEFGFTIIDATRNVHEQQRSIRKLISSGIDLARFRTKVSQWR
jgi:hypothetical protein